MAAGPFRSAGETSDETRPRENCEKRKTGEKKDGRGEDEVFVVERGAAAGGCGTGGVGRGRGTGGHRDLARPALRRLGEERKGDIRYSPLGPRSL